MDWAAKIVYIWNKQAVGGVLARLLEGAAIDSVPLSPYQIIDVALTVVLIYFMWKASKASENTKRK